ncbi:BOP1NT (NUC169) domain/WD domain, G-beta repeat [Novymonas esmeraldas]|uniref:Ribosome biogenesis protein BOP1 homolog n=1 Tax=Novymonas esmeraldas TaxID=1808958 RepID=A0AAW0F248_9TRYP
MAPKRRLSLTATGAPSATSASPKAASRPRVTPALSTAALSSRADERADGAAGSASASTSTPSSSNFYSPRTVPDAETPTAPATETVAREHDAHGYDRLRDTVLPDAEADADVSDDGGADDEDDIILFPHAEELGTAASGLGDDNDDDGVVRLGTTQHLDESDSSEDEATLNRVGDIPLEWYKDENHIGYDVEGKRLMKSERSALERLLEATDDPNMMRTIYDALHDEKKTLSNADLQLIFNLQRNRTTNSNYDMYAEVQEDTVVFDPLNHPLARGGGPSKKSFVPALHDMKVIAKMVRRMRKEEAERRLHPATAAKTEEAEEEQLLWDDGHVEMDTHTHFKYFNKVPKPKMPPPGTFESYRPPPEYLPSERAKQRQARLRAIDRKEHFLPQSFDALRHVPFYHHTIQDRYQRCLDLAFFPRAQRTRLVVDPDKLLPELPDPKDLRPYPERLSFHYKGHTATVRSVSVSPNGQYLATGCDDHLVRVFEVQTGRLMKRYDVGAPVQQVEFCPAKSLNILVVAVEYSLVFIVPTFAAHTLVNDHTIRFLRAPGMSAGKTTAAHALGAVDTLGGRAVTQTTLDADETAHEAMADLHDVEEREKRAEFVDASAKERDAGIVVKIAMHAKVKKFCFHAKGDYLCALCPKDHVKYRQTIMLQLSKRKVFCPFRKFSEVVTDCRFHPREPLFFLATTNSVRCYNLMAHRLQRRFKASGGVTTCLSIHPEGDNLLVGDTTSHTSWFDMDFSDKPYKRMRSHKGVVNAVSFHPNTNAYPLFATGASDGQVHVFHGMVYDDYNKNALLVPVKILKHQRPVYAVAWHPTLAWLFTSTEDGVVTAWTE